MDLIQPTLNVISSLHPVLGVLCNLYDEYRKIKANKAKCGTVVLRATGLLEAINGQLAGSGKPITADVQKNIDRMEEQFAQIRDSLARFARMRFHQQLLAAGQIQIAVDSGHRRLDDIVQCFTFITVAAVRMRQEDAEDARKKDMERLEQLLLTSGRRDADLLKALEI